MSDSINMIRMRVPLKHDILLVLHANILSHANGREVGWVDHGDEPFHSQRSEGVVAYRARSFGGVTLAPCGACQPITNFDFCLTIQIWKEK